MSKYFYRNVKNLLHVCPDVVIGSYEQNTLGFHLQILVSSLCLCIYVGMAVQRCQEIRKRPVKGARV